MEAYRRWALISRDGNQLITIDKAGETPGRIPARAARRLTPVSRRLSRALPRRRRGRRIFCLGPAVPEVCRGGRHRKIALGFAGRLKAWWRQLCGISSSCSGFRLGAADAVKKLPMHPCPAQYTPCRTGRLFSYCQPAYEAGGVERALNSSSVTWMSLYGYMSLCVYRSDHSRYLLYISKVSHCASLLTWAYLAPEE